MNNLASEYPNGWTCTSCGTEFSEKTINCLVYKGSNESIEAFKLINKIEKKNKKKVRLENILIEDIK